MERWASFAPEDNLEAGNVNNHKSTDGAQDIYVRAHSVVQQNEKEA